MQIGRLVYSSVWFGNNRRLYASVGCRMLCRSRSCRGGGNTVICLLGGIVGNENNCSAVSENVTSVYTPYFSHKR